MRLHAATAVGVRRVAEDRGVCDPAQNLSYPLSKT
jgi:hypothetical protein